MHIIYIIKSNLFHSSNLQIIIQAHCLETINITVTVYFLNESIYIEDTFVHSFTQFISIDFQASFKINSQLISARHTLKSSLKSFLHTYIVTYL